MQFSCPRQIHFHDSSRTTIWTLSPYRVTHALADVFWVGVLHRSAVNLRALNCSSASCKHDLPTVCIHVRSSSQLWCCFKWVWGIIIYVPHRSLGSLAHEHSSHYHNYWVGSQSTACLYHISSTCVPPVHAALDTVVYGSVRPGGQGPNTGGKVTEDAGGWRCMQAWHTHDLCSLPISWLVAAHVS